jgi:hypothetical protein
MEKGGVIIVGKPGQIPWNKGLKGVYSEAQLKAFSEVKQGDKNPMFGKTHTVETCARLSAACKQYNKDHPHKGGTPPSWKGKHHTPESIEKNRATNKKYYIDHPEQVERLREMGKERMSHIENNWCLSGPANPQWKGGISKDPIKKKEARWKREHISPKRFIPISTEELNAILQEND